MVARAVTRVEERGFPWWWVLVQGIALVILGGLFLVRPGMTVPIVAHVAGLYWFIAGVFQVVSAFLDSSLWSWKLVAGLLGVLAGIVAIRHPLWSSVVAGFTLVALLGAMGTIVGAAGMVQAIKGAGWSAGILGAANLVLGLVLLLNAWALTFSLPVVIGVVSLIGGIFSVIVALRIK